MGGQGRDGGEVVVSSPHDPLGLRFLVKAAVVIVIILVVSVVTWLVA